MIYNFTEEQKDKIIEQWGNEAYLKILNNIGIYSEKWGLYDFELVEYYSINAIFFCKSELYGDCVLKIGNSVQDKEFVGEYNTLREYNGKNFVKVYEGDIDIENGKKIMLIERCIPGNTLSEEKSLEKRLSVFSDLYNGLHIEPQNPDIYDSYEKWICDAAEECGKNRQNLSKYMQKAKEIYFKLCEKYNEKMLLHIDIFGDNIVSDNEKYRLIDPKGVIGDPVFETGQFIFAECCENGIEPEKAEIIFDYLEKSINIPDKVLRQCFYIETARFISGMSGDWGIKRIKFAESVLST